METANEKSPKAGEATPNIVKKTKIVVSADGKRTTTTTIQRKAEGIFGDSLQGHEAPAPGKGFSADVGDLEEGQGDAPQQGPAASPNDEIPEENYGCVRGVKRDGHIKHAVLWASLIAVLLTWFVVAVKYSSVDCDSYYNDCHFFVEMPGLAAFIFIFIYALFLVESFCLSSTFKYLRSINTTESIMDYLKRMYETEPRLVMRMECWHYETRIVHHTDSNGRSYTTTEQVPVVSWVGTEEIIIVSWRDESVPLEEEQIRQFQLTKVKLSKTFRGDEGYERQKNAFIEANRYRDVYHTFSVDLQIAGFKSHMMSYVDLSKKPEFLGAEWFIVTHLLILFSLPYRIWVSSITGKVAPNVHKAIFTC